MVSWQEFEAAAPDFATDVRARFGVRKHCTMATLRADGSPRISGTEVEFADGELKLGSGPKAVKARDLLRDPRVAIHSPTDDPAEGDEVSWQGEAKVAGRALELPKAQSHVPGAVIFTVDIDEVVHTRLTPDMQAMLVRSWHPDRGYTERRVT